MKITKRKWGARQPLFFYRDQVAGKLTKQDNRQEDFTGRLFADQPVAEVFERSLQSRLLKMYQKGEKNLQDKAIAGLVESLCKNRDLSEALGHIGCPIPKEEAEKRCDLTLSGYGKQVAADGGTTTLRGALLLLMTGNEAQRESAEAELGEIQRALQNEKKNRAARVKMSITGNKMPLRVENNSIKGNTERAEWLLALMRKDGQPSFYPVLDRMEHIFRFGQLAGELESKISECGGKPQAIAKTVDEAVRAHRRKVWEQSPDEIQNMKYYFQAVQEYFKENFPIRTKRAGARARQELLREKADRSRLLEPEHMKSAIRQRLIGQSTQMHILYGKLDAYCCSGVGLLSVDGDTLQKIQVMEAVKKQTMTAVLWSIARLSYFGQYRENGPDRDVILKQTYWEKYFESLSDQDIQACREKLQDFFPLEETADKQCCKNLLDACVACIRALRIQIFHYKGGNHFTGMLEETAEKAGKESSHILREFFDRDLGSLQEAFARRIESMNLPLYYRTELLSGIFEQFGTSFMLYCAKDQMTPSFRNVYERGKNLCGEYKLRWFYQIEDNGVDANARRAVRNLLKLLYQSCFLPAVQTDDLLVTRYISAVLSRNERLAEERHTPRKAGYGGVRELYREGRPLSELLKRMQRQISQNEQENRELARDKTDYAQRFLREVYAVAFNSFLDSKSSEFDFYDKIMSPQISAGRKKPRPEDLPRLHTSLTKENIGNLLVLYPVLRMLDGRELSEFQQQMLRYRTAVAQWPGKEAIESLQTVKRIEELAELVKLTEPVPKNAEEAWRNRAEPMFAPFIEDGMTEYGEFYRQSDGTTPVFRRSMNRLLRSGILGVYQFINGLPKQGTKKDLEVVRIGQWVMTNSEGRQVTFAEHAQNELQRLHRMYEISRFLSQPDRKNYRNILNWHEAYNHALHNLTFETLYGVFCVYLEMMSRWVGFAQNWERDMYFLLRAWARQKKIGLKMDDVDEIFDEGYVVCHLTKKLNGSDLAAFLSVYRSGVGSDLNFARVRNDIDHLDLMRNFGWTVNEKKAANTGSVVLNYFDRLRLLLSYDPKRMNAVTKVMLEILEEHKVKAAFAMKSGGKLKLLMVESEPIPHLKRSNDKDGVCVQSHGATYLQTLKNLMLCEKRNPT
ncbi:MAG: hypothetical protein GX424_02460 [Clostridiales bacterium]|nr:hypothetical protein [Clostridiales bacterium]